MRPTAIPLLIALLLLTRGAAGAQSISIPVAKTSPRTSTRSGSTRPTTIATPPAPKAGRTTLSGIYTTAEARAGRDMYAGLCANCHTAASHTGPGFRKKWAGRPLSDLFTFMRTMMPKNEPASLSDEDYGVLLAYMLQLNRMPAGRVSLSTDSLALAKIRIDTARTPARKSR